MQNSSRTCTWINRFLAMEDFIDLVLKRINANFELKVYQKCVLELMKFLFSEKTNEAFQLKIHNSRQYFWRRVIIWKGSETTYWDKMG